MSGIDDLPQVERIRRKRERAGWTRHQLAHHFKITGADLKAVERSRITFEQSLLDAIEGVLDAAVAALPPSSDKPGA